MAIAFLPNPNGFPIVNHKDGNPGNNTVENLEWCSPQHNSQHAVDTKLLDPAINHVEVIQYNYNHREIRRFSSLNEAQKCLGGNLNVQRAAKFPYGIAGGYVWRYATDPIEQLVIPDGKQYRNSPLIFLRDGTAYCTRKKRWLIPLANRYTGEPYYLYNIDKKRVPVWINEAIEELFPDK